MGYYCIVCGTRVESLEEVICPKCGSRILFKERPPVPKRLKTD